MTAEERRRQRLRAFQRRRRERLLAVLPRIYAQQPRGSVVYQLLDVIAGRLAEVDEALEQVMAGRWVRTASGAPLFAGLPPPLELLGALFDLPRLPRLPADPAHGKAEEESEAYRQRLMRMAAILSRGVTTPDVLLQLTRIIVGGDVLARVIDNPLVSREQTVRDLRHATRFRVRNDGLIADRPVLRITALDQAVAYPAVRNIATSEVVLYAGRIEKGQTLTIWPALEEIERREFSGLDRQDPHTWQIGASIGVQDVSQRIYYLAGAQFDKAVFPPWNAADGPNADPGWPRFANPGQKVQTPLLSPGEAQWDFLGYTKGDLTGVRGEFTDPPEQPTAGQVTVSLSFFTRAPATFLLEVENNDAIRGDPRRAQLLRQVVERVRAAGIRARVEFLEPPKPEDHGQYLTDGPPGITVAVGEKERAALDDRAPRIAGEMALAEPHALLDDDAIFVGVFDATRFDLSRLE